MVLSIDERRLRAELIKQKHGEGMSFTDIGKELGLTRERIRQIMKQNFNVVGVHRGGRPKKDVIVGTLEKSCAANGCVDKVSWVNVRLLPSTIGLFNRVKFCLVHKRRRSRFPKETCYKCGAVPRYESNKMCKGCSTATRMAWYYKIKKDPVRWKAYMDRQRAYDQRYRTKLRANKDNAAREREDGVSQDMRSEEDRTVREERVAVNGGVQDIAVEGVRDQVQVREEHL